MQQYETRRLVTPLPRPIRTDRLYILPDNRDKELGKKTVHYLVKNS